MHDSRSEFVDIRGLRYHLRHWNEPSSATPTLLMLHGWMDVSASFQFVVDALEALAPGHHVVAPDWRGYGLTARARADCYWFPDYLADLDAVVDHLVDHLGEGSGERRVVLVGHSMGGNIALLYAGIRPQRVQAVVNLEGFGLRDQPSSRAPERYAYWLDQLKTGGSLRDYASPREVAERLKRNNPRLTDERAAFLAQHWAQPQADGRWVVAGDPAHRLVNPVLYRLDESLACWARIECPVLWVRASDTDVLKHVDVDAATALAEIERRRDVIRGVRSLVIEDAGHMLHHDQPMRVARAIADSLAAPVRGPTAADP